RSYGGQMSILGTRVVRIEDPRLLTAGGTYVDDLRVPQLMGAARVTFVRSHHGHALITGVDASAALAAPGVVAVLTYQDIDDIPPPPPLPEGGPPPGSEAAPLPMGGVWQEPLLAVDRVRFVGEPVAMVLTDDSYQGEDAAELVSVDYEPLPAIVDRADAAVPRRGVERGRGPSRGRHGVRGLRRRGLPRHREPAGGAGAHGGPGR